MKLTANSPMYTNRPGLKRKGVSLQSTNFQGPTVGSLGCVSFIKIDFFGISHPPNCMIGIPLDFLNINVHDSKKVLLHLLLQGVVPLLSLLVLCPQFLHLLCQAMCISRSRCKARPLEMAKKPPTYRPGTYPIPYTRVRNVKKV